MFDSLSEKLQGTLADLRRHGALSERDIDAAMREVRLALLEADVNFKVAKRFTEEVKSRCLSAVADDSSASSVRLNPGQRVVAIVAEQLTELLGGQSGEGGQGGQSGEAGEGGEAGELRFAAHPPTVILLAGLQGSGKTTAAAKLARLLRERRGSAVALAACDLQRPAAVDQLVTVGEQAGATVYRQSPPAHQASPGDPVEVASWALDRARQDGKDVLIVDTSGRLHVDDELMRELVRMREALQPQQVLLVVDAMTGQDAVNVAERFAEAVALDGVVITKLDGDARGGAALSVKAVTGRPILFASTGERLEQFEPFHPDRMAQRILGMGDVMTLIEKAEHEFEQRDALELERRLRRGEFGLDDFLEQLRTIRRMGPLSGLLGMIPGMGAQLRGVKIDERELDRLQAVILSMTPHERRHPELIKGSRRLRIARGSGTNVQQVAQLVKQFEQMRKMMRQVGRGRMPDLGALMRQAR
ncbi:MAG: signal recognition particle protein [Solirubrobacterales bacterium]|nr:signal recognition particle protein [Solirubrobacterales bacterium]